MSNLSKSITSVMVYRLLGGGKIGGDGGYVGGSGGSYGGFGC